MRAALAQVRGPRPLAAGPASLPEPELAQAAGEAAPPRLADYQFSDRMGPSEQAAEEGVGAEAERAPRALRRQVGAWRERAGLVQALVQALARRARRRSWPRAAWGLRPGHRRARSWSIPAPQGDSTAR